MADWIDKVAPGGERPISDYDDVIAAKAKQLGDSIRSRVEGDLLRLADKYPFRELPKIKPSGQALTLDVERFPRTITECHVTPHMVRVSVTHHRSVHLEPDEPAIRCADISLNNARQIDVREDGKRVDVTEIAEWILRPFFEEVGSGSV